jgi:hypothetical protein
MHTWYKPQAKNIEMNQEMWLTQGSSFAYFKWIFEHIFDENFKIFIMVIT